MSIYQIQKYIKPGTKRVFFIPLMNGHRVGKTNYARKYDAQTAIRNIRKKYTDEQAIKRFSKNPLQSELK